WRACSPRRWVPSDPIPPPRRPIAIPRPRRHRSRTRHPRRRITPSGSVANSSPIAPPPPRCSSRTTKTSRLASSTTRPIPAPKPVGKGTGKDFWGVDEDAKSLAQFISQYVSRNGRWASPKYLIGESYGTTRSAVLGDRLQRDGVTLNGIVLISSVLDFETLLFSPGHDLSYVLYLPSYAATAVFHKVIPAPSNVPGFL